VKFRDIGYENRKWVQLAQDCVQRYRVELSGSLTTVLVSIYYMFLINLILNNIPCILIYIRTFI